MAGKRIRLSRSLPLVMALLFLSTPATAARADRVTVATEHFLLSIDVHKAKALKELSGPLEQYYRILCEHFDYEPEHPIRLAFLDEDDLGNGAALAQTGWVLIHLHAAHFQLRGMHEWLPNVISHELAHIITLRKMGVRSSFLALQLSSSWRLSETFSHQENAQIPFGNYPNWLAEGLAQHGARQCGNDTLDAHRRMILRIAALTGGLLDLKELETFAWDARRNEMIYTQGFALVEFLYRRFGRDKMNQALAAMDDHGMEVAFVRVLGMSASEIYAQWKTELEQESRDWKLQEPRPLVSPPRGIPYIVQSHIGTASGVTLYTDSRNNDFGNLDLYWMRKGERWMLSKNVTGVLEMMPADGSAIFLSTRKKTFHQTLFQDIYRVDLQTGYVAPLTKEGDVWWASPNPDGRVYAIQDVAGKTFLSRLSRERLQKVAESPKTGWELRQISPGPGKGQFFATLVRGTDNDIVLWNPSNAAATRTVAGRARFQERDPHWNGKRLYYSADYAGAFDIYSTDGEDLIRHTAVTGGAFQPNVQNGRIRYSEYCESGFVITSVGNASSFALPAVVRSNEAGTIPLSDTVVGNPPEGQRAAAPSLSPRYTDGMKFLGYSLGASVQGFGSLEVPVGIVRADTLAILDRKHRPFTTVSTAGSLIWTSPTFEAQAALSAQVSKPVDFEENSGAYLSGLEAGLIREMGWGTFLVGFGYQGLRYPVIQLEEDTVGLFQTAITIQGAMVTPMSRWVQSSSSIVLDGVLMQTDSVYPVGGAGFLVDQSFRYAALDHGMDLIRSGMEATIGLQVVPIAGGIFLPHLGGVRHGHLGRLLHYQLGAEGAFALGAVSGTVGQVHSQMLLDLPLGLGLRLGPSGGRQLAFERFFPFARVGASAFHLEANVDLSRDFSSLADTHRFQAARSDGFPGGARFGERPPEDTGGLGSANTATALSLGTHIKTIGLFRQVNYWSFFISFGSASDLSSPAYHLSFSL